MAFGYTLDRPGRSQLLATYDAYVRQECRLADLLHMARMLEKKNRSAAMSDPSLQCVVEDIYSMESMDAHVDWRGRQLPLTHADWQLYQRHRLALLCPAMLLRKKHCHWTRSQIISGAGVLFYLAVLILTIAFTGWGLHLLLVSFVVLPIEVVRGFEPRWLGIKPDEAPMNRCHPFGSRQQLVEARRLTPGFQKRPYPMAQGAKVGVASTSMFRRAVTWLARPIRVVLAWCYLAPILLLITLISPVVLLVNTMLPSKQTEVVLARPA